VKLVGAVALALLMTRPARAEVSADRFHGAGYLRIMTRPDFQGGDGRLGFWNLYGRLLNEGPWAALALKLDLLERDPVGGTPWANVQARIEGGSVSGADARMGSLEAYRMMQLYAQAGNILIDGVTWQIGSLDYYLGDLGLYDVRLAEVFFDTIGLSARYDTRALELLVGVGDAGFSIRGARYSTVFTAGGLARVRLLDKLELGAGGQVYYEPEVEGNRFAPHQTPDIPFEDYLRGEAAMRWVMDHPGMENMFPRPQPTSSESWKLIGYLGFGGIGPLRWNNLFANFLLRHPDGFVTETFEGRDYFIYVEGFTDERYQVNVGNEMQLVLWPGRLDAVWGILYGKHWNHDNSIAATDDDRTYASTVLRLQAYATERVHLLMETSIASEKSEEGNLYREHADSVFRSSGGLQDPRGLEFGDAAERRTWQGKIGWVLNPLGTGIYTRPSLRVLYGVQWSSQQAAFGNSFVTSLDESNIFGQPRELHWHHVVALEAEAWF
jgi:hypothetical protein